SPVHTTRRPPLPSTPFPYTTLFRSRPPARRGRRSPGTAGGEAGSKRHAPPFPRRALFGEILPVVPAAALFALQRRAGDELSGLDHVVQRPGVPRRGALDLRQGVQSPAEALGAANDSHVIPHHLPQPCHQLGKFPGAVPVRPALDEAAPGGQLLLV